MSQFTVVPIYKKGLTRYTAPAFTVEASTNGDAKQMASNSGLGRFPDWSFHVIETNKVKKQFNGVVARKKLKV